LATIALAYGAEMGKLGQIRDTKPKNGTHGRLGRIVIFPGHVVKNQDCPRKSGTDGHLILVKSNKTRQS